MCVVSQTHIVSGSDFPFQQTSVGRGESFLGDGQHLVGFTPCLVRCGEISVGDRRSFVRRPPTFVRGRQTFLRGEQGFAGPETLVSLSHEDLFINHQPLSRANEDLSAADEPLPATHGVLWVAGKGLFSFQQENNVMAQQRLRVLLSFTHQSDHQIEETAEAVIAGNSAFPGPPVDLTVLQKTLTEFSAAIAASIQGGVALTAVKNKKRHELVALLRQLAVYVQAHCHDDLATLLSSGFLAASTSRAPSVLPKPIIAGVDHRNSTQLLVRLEAIEIRCGGMLSRKSLQAHPASCGFMRCDL